MLFATTLIAPALAKHHPLDILTRRAEDAAWSGVVHKTGCASRMALCLPSAADAKAECEQDNDCGGVERTGSGRTREYCLCEGSGTKANRFAKYLGLEDRADDAPVVHKWARKPVGNMACKTRQSGSCYDAPGTAKATCMSDETCGGVMRTGQQGGYSYCLCDGGETVSLRGSLFLGLERVRTWRSPKGGKACATRQPTCYKEWSKAMSTCQADLSCGGVMRTGRRVKSYCLCQGSETVDNKLSMFRSYA